MKKVHIIGTGISGMGAAKAAMRLGCDVSVFNGDNYWERREIFDADEVVVSPGIRIDEAKLPDGWRRPISEIEYAFINSKCRWIAVTGSVGKSTVCSMINAIFDNTTIPHALCGNIGFSAAERAPLLPENGVAICEVSSFQLETTRTFKPDVAVLLNIYPNHLDRHNTMEEYRNIKHKIFENMGTNGLKLRYCDNITAVMAAAVYFGIAKETIKDAVTKFQGLEHRMEYCGSLGGIDFFNDSKATTCQSVVSAVSRFGRKSVHLIVGGRDKGVPFEPYKDLIMKKCKKVYAIGEASGKIKNAWGKSVVECGTLETAVKEIMGNVKEGESVLLSPACASFDQYKNFEERGIRFKELVKEIINEGQR